MNIRFYPSSFAAFSLVAAAMIATPAEAVDPTLTKLNNGTSLGSAGSWSENIAPNGTQIGVWTSTWDNTFTSVFTGATLLGIKLQSGAAPVSLVASGANGIMTLGTSGFNLESGTQLNFTGGGSVTGTIDFAGAQTWNLGSGSTLSFNTQYTLFTGDSTENITVTGSGALNFSFRSNNNSTVTLGSGSLTFTGGQRWINNATNTNTFTSNSIVANKVFVNGNTISQCHKLNEPMIISFILSGDTKQPHRRQTHVDEYETLPAHLRDPHSSWFYSQPDLDASGRDTSDRSSC